MATDPEVLALNQRAASAMTAPHPLAVVPAASPLFAEAGALEAVRDLAREWLAQSLRPADSPPASPMP
jgi:hypothetical protein